MSVPSFYFVEDLGELFQQIQEQKIFSDSKYFVDCSPKEETASILQAYQEQKGLPEFDLREFVLRYFETPPTLSTSYFSEGKEIKQHMDDLWDFLTRAPMHHQGTLLALPHPYVVPGGRFREIFYWDSYFTMLGLQVAGRVSLIENMVKNFAHIIDCIGFIPNGNRTYFMTRSQPPFFSLMVELLAEEQGAHILQTYLPQLEKEYTWWMNGAGLLKEPGTAIDRLVLLDDGLFLNRYWDFKDTARPEASLEEKQVALRSGRPHSQVYRNLRAACESGWDYSSRWLRDGIHLETIETTDIIPVDLNCLLLHLEELLLKLYTINENEQGIAKMESALQNRYKAIRQYCWDEEKGFYFDYHFVDRMKTSKFSLAAIFPLFFRVATSQEAARIAAIIEKEFLYPGGLITTLVQTGQQWDAPNGWAPLQWMAYKGLMQYGYEQLAATVSDRWLRNVELVYQDTGKCMEKYDVVQVKAKAGGGKYPNQDGFGWTNGVYLKLLSAAHSSLSKSSTPSLFNIK